MDDDLDDKVVDDGEELDLDADGNPITEKDDENIDGVESDPEDDDGETD